MRSTKIKGKASRLALSACALAILAVTGTLCGMYYNFLQNTVKEESGEYIQEISKQIAINISKTISDNFSVLGTVSMALRTSGSSSFDEISPIIEDQRDYWSFESIMFADSAGTIYDTRANKVILDSDEYLTQVVIDRKNTVTTSNINGKDYLLFASPLTGVALDGHAMAAIMVTYNLDKVNPILSLTAFDGQAYCHVINRNGSVVIRSTSENAPPTSYNLLNYMAAAEMKNDITLDDLKKAVASGKSGQIEYTLQGESKYMAYTPLYEHEWCLLTIVPTSAANKKTDVFMSITLMLCVIIALIFSLLTVFLFTSFYRHKKKLEQIAYVDPLTGGATIQRFYEQVTNALARTNRPSYALLYTNLQKFKLFNEQFGRVVCDDILRRFHALIVKNLTDDEFIGRISADNFCLLVKCSDVTDLCHRISAWHNEATTNKVILQQPWPVPTVEFGVYIITDGDESSLDVMSTRAKMALSESAHTINDRLRYAVYTEEHRKKLFREKNLEDRMEAALRENEFHVYLQPKYNAKSETIGGAEALVRWISPEGMIFPDEFIPLFEKNGFVLKLDLFVFEQVCKSLRKWLDAGLDPMKISVNCSRVHLQNKNFLHTYIEICERIGVPPNLLEIELTETVVFEDVEGFAYITNTIHEAGFGCSMDDFGSGYSSLSLLRDIRVDTIKLDKVFFKDFNDLERTEAVVESIIQMAKRLHMDTVAEGVETKEQAKLLSRLGCDLIQGYYYAKPMPIPAFEKRTFGEDINF